MQDDEDFALLLKPRFGAHVLPWLALGVPALIGLVRAVGIKIDSDLRPFVMAGGMLAVLGLQLPLLLRLASAKRADAALRTGATVSLVTRVLLSAALLAWAVRYVDMPGYKRERLMPVEEVEMPNPDSKEGGCPCGCDHSLAMADELRQEERDLAQQGIDRSLSTISEREDAGYITEAMVEHRLRLLSLRRELHIDAPWDREGRLGAPPMLPSEQTSETLVAHAELLVFGATTELVHGKPKALLPTFLARVLVTNRTPQALQLASPVLEGNVHLPVRRWYLRGGDGSPWDGRLGPHETRSVHVIGYIDGPLAPGEDVRATLTVADLVLAFETRARGRWDGQL